MITIFRVKTKFTNIELFLESGFHRDTLNNIYLYISASSPSFCHVQVDVVKTWSALGLSENWYLVSTWTW